MKRLLFIVMAAAALMAVSCKERMQFVYCADISGDSDGHVLVSFPDGKLNINGDANLVFHYSNDSTKCETIIYTPEQVRLQGIRKAEPVLVAAERVIEGFNVTSAEGTYDVYVRGYVKESLTGITFKIDKRFTNK